MDAGTFDVFRCVSVMVELAPGEYCSLVGAHVLPTVVSTVIGTLTVTLAPSEAGWELSAVTRAVLVTATPFDAHVGGKLAGALSVTEMT